MKLYFGYACPSTNDFNIAEVEATWKEDLNEYELCIKDNAAIAPDEKKHISVIFDKPFIFMIKDTKTNEIAFFGVVYDVEKWTGKACEE